VKGQFNLTMTLKRRAAGLRPCEKIAAFDPALKIPVPHLRRSGVWSFRIPALRPGLLTTASSRLVWKSLAILCFDRVSKKTRREAPEVSSGPPPPKAGWSLVSLTDRGLTAGPTYYRLFEAGLEMAGGIAVRRMGIEKRREAPGVSSRARKRVVS
jgi:hypothetical protein